MEVEMRKGNMFDIADEPDFKSFALAHCISEDCVMGKGIATEFKKRFGGVSDLKKQVASGKKTGFACVLKKERPVYYLITKKAYYNKPSYENLRKSLEDMRSSIADLEVTGVVMPRIGCGLDRLQWDKVLVIIKEVFKNTDVKVVVCSL